MLDQIGFGWICDYNPTKTWFGKCMWYNQWPYFISSHEQLTKELAIDQDLRDWITKKLEFDHLRLPRRSMNALIEEEMKMNLIRRMQHLLSPMNSLFWSYPFSLISAIYFYEQLPHTHLRFCNLLSAIYIQLFISSIYCFCYLLSRHLIFCKSQIKFWFAQLEHSSN